jgi:hypothetical protein
MEEEWRTDRRGEEKEKGRERALNSIGKWRPIRVLKWGIHISNGWEGGVGFWRGKWREGSEKWVIWGKEGGVWGRIGKLWRYE